METEKMRKPKTAPTKAPAPKTLLPAMIEAAEKGGKILRKYWEQNEKLRGMRPTSAARGKFSASIEEKAGDAGLVTIADFESERACVNVLKKVSKDFGFLTEEGTMEHAKKSGTATPIGRWILDPLDGTTNFVHGFPMFCVSLAAEVNGQVVAGVIYHPVLGDLYTAVAGGGASVNGRKLQVSSTRSITDSLLSTGFTTRKNQYLSDEMEAFEAVSKSARAVRRPGSAALDLAYVARGVFDGFWERRLAPWDIAAGALLVQEAGGKVTDFSGRPFHVEQKSILASNALLHRAILPLVEE